MDVFDAFELPIGHVHVEAPAAGAATTGVAAEGTSGGRKRPRDAAEPGSISHVGVIDDATVVAGVMGARKQGRAAHDFGDAIDAASVLDVDAAARDSVVDITIAPPPESSGVEASAAPPARRGSVDETRTTAPAAAGPASTSAPPSTPAKTYPFVLDPFQRRAIECLERDESVLVSAHTSAGKTVVAEYAIAMALRDKQRVVYTSPIKALSNQKYRDLYEEFSDVGLMTGDVTINPNASCLVMTTEILRSMLYRGSEIMREVKWVVFDEIHYMRDKERGVVWEESIIMLPHKVRFVFLSATIPNAKEFAEWIAAIHAQTCHVVYTDYRPTPLQHFIFPSGAEGVYLVVDEKGRFRDDNFTKAMAALGSSSLADAVEDVVSKGAGKKDRAKSMGKGKGPSDLFRIIKMIMDRQYDPVIVFSFSKRECEQYALQIARLDMTSPEEKQLIERVFVNAIDSLSEDDKRLPQIDAILPLLKRGIGIHHGGLLPILKEVIEILFQESLLKVLFATETFSMGINMPARTVVFTASRKFDGTDFRWISPGEYIQMSGRAGRRGLDTRGIVIQMVDEKMEPAAAKEILKGSTDPLNSAFHLGYNMLLNLMRVEDADPEKIMKLSFHQFQNEKALPAMEEELLRLQAERDAIVVPNEPAVAEYCNLVRNEEELQGRMRIFVTQARIATPFLTPGRLLRIRDGDTEWGWSVVVNCQRARRPTFAIGVPAADAADAAAAPSDEQVVVDALVPCSRDTPVGKPSPAAAGAPFELRVLSIALSCVHSISSARLYIPKDLRSREVRDTVAERLREVHRRMAGAVPLLHPVDDMRITDTGFLDMLAQSKELQARITSLPLHATSTREADCALFQAKLDCNDKCTFLTDRISACRALVMRDELKKMKRVLRRLGYVDADNVVQAKGRVACEINSADELLCTELIFNGVFNTLDAAQSAALLSCFVSNEKGDEDGGPTREELAAPLRALQAAARRIAEVSQDCKLPLDTEEYVKSFHADCMELVYAWVNGAKFVDICGMTKQFEGSVIRVIRRLEELTRQLADAAKAIGDMELSKKFAEASTKMRRDIVFAASLYL